MTARLRVLQIIAGVAIGDQNGGAEQFGIHLARCLDRSAFESAIYAMWSYDSQPERAWLERLKGENIAVGGLIPAKGPVPQQLARIAADIRQFAGQFRPHITTSHSQRGDPLALLLRWLGPAFPRAVRTVHLDRVWLNRPWLDLPFSQFIAPLAFDKEVVTSQALHQRLSRRRLAAALGRDYPLIYNGIEPALFDYQPHQAPPDIAVIPRPRIAAIGRLHPQKGFADLLQAVSLIQPVHRPQTLIIGTGSLEEELRALASNLGVDRQVHFLGSRLDLFDLLPACDLLVSPSHWEGFSTIVLQAMALGVPVLATAVSGSAELIVHEQTGWLVPPSQPQRLADMIERALRQPETRKSFAAAAKEHARPFTLGQAARQFENLYQQLVE